MKTTAPVFGCKWCGKKLAPKFDRERKRMGHGLEGCGFFCSKACAVNWAHKQLAIQQALDKVMKEYECGTMAMLAKRGVQ
jgi:hypothetical protein